MKSVKQEFETTNITVTSGEIVQLIGTLPESCSIYKNGLSTKPNSIVIYPENKVSKTHTCPVFHAASVAWHLECWLADVPVRSVKALVAELGLEEAFDLPFDLADTDICFRLNMLKAVLEGKQVIQMVSPWKVSDVTDFMLAIREFAVEQAEQRSEEAPAFVVYDGDDSTGISLIADDILVVEAGRLQNPLVLL